jgi:hypothetical protein
MDHHHSFSFTSSASLSLTLAMRGERETLQSLNSLTHGQNQIQLKELTALILEYPQLLSSFDINPGLFLSFFLSLISVVLLDVLHLIRKDFEEEKISFIQFCICLAHVATSSFGNIWLLHQVCLSQAHLMS